MGPGMGFEAAMDVEAVHATAPGAHIVVLYDVGDLVDSIDYVASNHLANVVSNSWSYNTSDTQLPSSLVSSVDSRLAMDSAQGLTILFASGDQGARPDGSTMGTEFPASDPNVLAVGATNLFLSGCGTTTCTGYSSETGAVISGGGYSGYFAEPSWQKTAIGSVSGRAVPDVSMMGYYPNFWVYSTASNMCGTSGTTAAGWFGCAGTSLSTPLWAGLMAIIVQAKGGSSLGNFAPAIWQLAGSASYSNDFHDVTSGSNNGYSAGPGWDPVTGWGTPVASNLVASLITRASFDTNLDASSDIAASTPILTVTVGGTGSSCTGGSKTTVTHGMLPYSTANLAAGTDVCYSYASAAASTTTGKQYSWTSISAATGSAAGQSGQSGSFTIASTSTVTAAYQAQYFLTVGVSPSGAGSTTPSSEWVNAGSTVTITAAPASGATFSGWSCTGSGCYSQASNPTSPITVNNPVTETAGFKTSTSALSLDGSISGGVNLGTTVSVSLTTSCSPDVILVLIGENTARGTSAAAAPTSSGLTFALRASLLSGTMHVWEYYAIASSPLKSQAITEVMSQPTAYTVTALGVCGANTAAPFDTSPGLPRTTGLSGTSHSNTVTTSLANDLVLDFDASQGNPTYTPLNAYTSVLTQQVSSWMASSAGYKVVSSTQTGTSLGFTLSVGQSGSQIVDAIVAATSSPPVTQPITLTLNEAGAVTAVFTINGCGATPSTIPGDGAPHLVTMQPSCSFTLSHANSGSSRYGFIAGGSFSATSPSQSTCPSGTCTGLSLGYDLQEKLTVTGGFGVTQSLASETNDGWYKYSDALTVSSGGIGTRTAGTGTRVTSWQIDAGATNAVATTGPVTTSTIVMNATHTVTFASVAQFQVILDSGATSALSSVTSPSIAGDKYWYDSGTSVTLVLNGVQGRSSGTGSRLSSYTINSGTPTAVSTTGTVTVLNATPLAAPESVTTSTVVQHQVTFADSPSSGGSSAATTSPTISGDTGWYDTGAVVSVSASPSGGFTFTSWTGTGTGSFTGSANPASITMSAPITETANFGTSTSALSLDGSISGGINLGTTVSVSLTTSCSPDVILVLIGENTARGTAAPSAPTSTGLTFTSRASLQSGGVREWEYYSISSAPLRSQAITEVMSQPTAYTLTALGVCGAYTSAPFDTSPGLPRTTGLSGTSHSNVVTTSNPTDLIIDFDASQGNPTYAPLNGYTSVLTQEVSSWMASSAEYKVVSSTQSGSSLGFTLSVGESGSQIVDAILSASSSTVTISGPPPPPSGSTTFSKAPGASSSVAQGAPRSR